MSAFVTSQNGGTVLQQRLRYVADHPATDWCVAVDNVPKWPTMPPVERFEIHNALAEYMPAEGAMVLREVIATRASEQFTRTVSPMQVVVTNGALHGIALLLQETALPGDRIITLGPILTSIAEQLTQLGLILWTAQSLKEVHDELSREDGSCRVVYVNTPHNPTGEVLSAEEARWLQTAAAACGAHLIVDLAYSDYAPDRSRAFMKNLSVEGSSVHCVSSMSKNYGLPGLRIGWVVTSESTASALAAGVERGVIAVNGHAQQIAAGVLSSQDNEPLRARVAEGRELMVDWLRRYRPEDKLVSGGTHHWLPVESTNRGDDFADYAMATTGLVLGTGSNYHGPLQPGVRVPLGVSRDELVFILARLADSLKMWPKVIQTTKVLTDKSMAPEATLQ